MNQTMCNNCGGDYEYRGGRWICRCCGAYKPEEISAEEVTLLYTASQKLRLAEFYEAEQAFDDIVRKYPQNPNGYWGRLMSRYGIKYEEDYDGRRIPTCYATSIESVLSDADYQKALKYADKETQEYYTRQAEYVERVRKEWVEKASKEKPYDIFICYKDSDLANGIERTQDSIAAQDLYIHLTNKGYRVFYSHESLRNKVGEKYEPYIFNALSTAKVMLVYGSKPEYITSTWLKNEWTRYEKRINAGEKKSNSLLVACDGFTPGALPTALSSRQCFDASRKSFYSDLDEVVDKLLKKEKKVDAEAAPVKKKSKAPVLVALITVALLAVGGIVAGSLLGQSNTQDSLTNTQFQATVVAHDKDFPAGTVFSIEEILSTAQPEAIQSIIASLPVDTDHAHVYDMNLLYNDIVLSVDGNITVTLALPDDVSAERAVVYYLTETSYKKVSSEVSNGKISFMTNHFSYYMIAESSDAVTEETNAPETSAPETSAPGTSEPETSEPETSPETEPHEHEYGEWTVKEATCTSDGSRSQSCACGDVITEVLPALGHTEVIDAAIDATCTSTGLREGKHCSVCETILVAQTSIPARGHNQVIDEAVVPTCTTTGLTEGKHCSNCNTVFTAQTMIAALGHAAVTDGGFDATCTETGLTEGSHCSVCDEILVAQETIDALGHTEEIDAGFDATCTEAGISEGSHCSVCDEILVAQETIDALGHIEVIDEAVEPTCTETGLTEGAHCAVCDEILVAQETVDALGHTEVTDKAVDATCTDTGLTEGSHCSVCDEVLVAQETVDALGHTEVTDEGFDATCTEAGLSEGSHCSVCDEILVAQETVDALGHTEVTDEAVEPTCTETGLTEGSHCSVCDEILVARETIDALGHIEVIDEGFDATCTETGLTDGSHCSVCDEILTEQVSIPAIGHTPENNACSVCGKVLAYTVTFVLNGYDAIPNQMVAEGDAAVKPNVSVGAVSRVVWYTDSTFVAGTEYDFDSVVTEDLTLYGRIVSTAGELPVNVFYAADLKNFVSSRNLKYAELVNDSFLFLVPTNADGNYYPFSNTEGARYVAIRYRTSDATDAYVQIYLASSGLGPTNDSSMLKQIITVDGEWHVAILDTQSLIDAGIYDGSYVSYFRLDFLHFDHTDIPENCSIDIAYVAFFGSVEDAEIFDESIPKDDTRFEGEIPENTDVTGLEFSLSADGESYFVVGIGSCTMEHLVIPSTYCGRPVTKIDPSAFWGVDFLVSVVIPDSVTEICQDAFPYCDNLTTVYLGSGLQHIDNWVFFDCDSLADIYYNGTADEWEAVDKSSAWISNTNNVTIHFVEAPAHEHVVVIDEAVDPTCTEAGLTEGSHCSECGEVLVAQETVDALGHTEVTDEAVEPNCTETGLTEGSHCSECGDVLVAQETVDALGHTEVTDDGIDPTCTEAGLTEGSHCSVCDEIFVEQEEVPANGHSFVEGVCTACNKTHLTEPQITSHDFSKDPDDPTVIVEQALTIMWDAVPNASLYNVYLAEVGYESSPDFEIKGLTELTVTIPKDDASAWGEYTDYRLKLVVKDSYGNVEISYYYIRVTKSTITAPVVSSPALATDDEDDLPSFYDDFTVAWSEVESAVSYRVRIYAFENDDYEMIYEQEGITDTSLVIPLDELYAGGRFKMVVRATDAYGNSKGSSYYFIVGDKDHIELTVDSWSPAYDDTHKYSYVLTVGDWTATPSAAWISVDAESGTGATYVKINVTKNTGDSIRSGYVTFTNEWGKTVSLMITQGAINAAQTDLIQIITPALNESVAEEDLSVTWSVKYGYAYFEVDLIDLATEQTVYHASNIILKQYQIPAEYLEQGHSYCLVVSIFNYDETKGAEARTIFCVE